MPPATLENVMKFAIYCSGKLLKIVEIEDVAELYDLMDIGDHAINAQNRHEKYALGLNAGWLELQAF